MHNTKYIVFVDNYVETMIIFPATQVHALVARRLCGRDRVVSAGFLQLGIGTVPRYDMPSIPEREVVVVRAFGESESLGVKSRPEEDSQLAQMLLAPN